ncbi:hypothetical protein MLD52_22570 [Puniceicoccaceae bacterium K14]|nr:hypothetical protein [Puniceicoccaceae bacterium K14]
MDFLLVPRSIATVLEEACDACGVSAKTHENKLMQAFESSGHLDGKEDFTLSLEADHSKVVFAIF